MFDFVHDSFHRGRKILFFCVPKFIKNRRIFIGWLTKEFVYFFRGRKLYFLIATNIQMLLLALFYPYSMCQCEQCCAPDVCRILLIVDCDGWWFDLIWMRTPNQTKPKQKQSFSNHALFIPSNVECQLPLYLIHMMFIRSNGQCSTQKSH